MRKISKRAKVIVASTLVLSALGGGIAFAYWSTTGTGSGSATTSAGASHLSFADSTATTAGDLAPGGVGVDIAGTVTNNATNNAYVKDVKVTIKDITQAAGATGSCDASDYNITNETMQVRTDLAPGDSKGFSGAKLLFVNKSTSQDGCKGATVNLKFESN